MKALGRLLTFVGMAALAVAAAVAMAMLCANLYVFSQIKSAVAFALPAYAGIDPQLASAAGWVIGLIAGPWLTVWLVKLILGYASPASAMSALLAAAALGAAYTWIRADWLFDERGRPLAYVCQGIVPGQRPRVQRQPVDHHLGGQCPAVDRNAAKVIAPLLQGASAPKSYEVPVSGDARLRDPISGAPLVWAGMPREGNAVPALYEGPGFDPFAANTLLRPATQDDVRRIIKARNLQAKLEAEQAAARHKEMEAAVAAAIERERVESQERERAASEQHAQELAQREAAVRADAQREASAREQEQQRAASERHAQELAQREAAVRADAQREASAREQEQQRAVQLELQAQEAARRAAEADAARLRMATQSQIYFRQPLDAADTLLVLTGTPIDARGQEAIARRVAPYISIYWAHSVATDAFFQTLQLDNIIAGDLSSMRNVRWPQGLNRIIFVQVIGVLPNGAIQYRVRRTRLNKGRSALHIHRMPYEGRHA